MDALPLSLLQLLLANLAIAAGALLQGVAGYGIGTLSAPLLFLISPALVPGTLTMNAMVLTVLMLVRNRTSLGFAAVRHAMLGAAIGTLAAAVVLTRLSPAGFGLAFGVLILLAVGLSVAGLKPALNQRNSILAGGLSGFMGTITAVGGPPIALIYQRQPAELVRANLSAFFLFGSATAFLGLLMSGFIHQLEVTLFSLTVPGVLVGFWLSGRLLHRVPGGALRPLILTIAALSGTGAIVRSLLA
ncbi:hypothetical protein CHH28_18105 [Bacterioplanes sanyensis]|uniref:Probable membrane transporter protein n=1 Tax=Bacterioplanes sanyensis TaxID=1249553 RepID=A0A222FPZ6_9GAMM|nr:sulfite exporter TauE/SafE family protein [Bacterioplanes sanyensis]ASP40471.1 hypothetical protein CHH28_18105 [Bacterioplanes sanyensis]